MVRIGSLIQEKNRFKGLNVGIEIFKRGSTSSDQLRIDLFASMKCLLSMKFSKTYVPLEIQELSFEILGREKDDDKSSKSQRFFLLFFMYE